MFERDQPLEPRRLLRYAGLLIQRPRSAAALQALNDPETGGAWVVQPNRVLQFRFPNIPGPR